MAFKALVRIDQHTDVDDTMRRLTECAANSKLAPNVRNAVLSQSRKVIEDFFNRGTALAKVGSQMSISQTIDGPGYLVRIRAHFGTRESIWERIIGAFTGRSRV